MFSNNVVYKANLSQILERNLSSLLKGMCYVVAVAIYVKGGGSNQYSKILTSKALYKA